MQSRLTVTSPKILVFFDFSDNFTKCRDGLPVLSEAHTPIIRSKQRVPQGSASQLNKLQLHYTTTNKKV